MQMSESIFDVRNKIIILTISLFRINNGLPTQAKG